MITKVFLTGNQAIAEAVRLAKVQFISAYPITPATGIIDHLTQIYRKRNFHPPANILHCESEFSAISSALGAELGGIRAFTATSSQGLMMMSEATYYASGMRIPLVMAVANRGLSAPVTIFADHQDSVSLRDNGWIQFYVKNVQEALDTILIAYRVAESEKVLLPTMVCLDGFYLSHLVEPLEFPAADFVGEFVPEFPHMDLNDPKFLGTAAWPDYYSEFVFLRHKAMEHALIEIEKMNNEFNQFSGRKYGLIEVYPEKLDTVELLLVGMGSMMETLETVIDENSNSSPKVGLVRVKNLRPFPAAKLTKVFEYLSPRVIGIIDRSLSVGSSGPLFLEISSLIKKNELDIKCVDIIAGIGGRDITPETGKKIIKLLNEDLHEKFSWVDLNGVTVKRWSKSNE